MIISAGRVSRLLPDRSQISVLVAPGSTAILDGGTTTLAVVHALPVDLREAAAGGNLDVTVKFTPGVHVNYAETVLPMKDGLPKFDDLPSQSGGSGKMIAE